MVIIDAINNNIGSSKALLSFNFAPKMSPMLQNIKTIPAIIHCEMSKSKPTNSNMTDTIIPNI